MNIYTNRKANDRINGIAPNRTFGSNMFKVNVPGFNNPLNSDAWVASGQGTYSDFWQLRTNAINSAFNDAIQLGTPDVRLDNLFKTGSNVYAPDVAKFYASKSSWDNLIDILDNGGTIYGFDTETIGPMSSPFVTEYGYASVNIANGKKINTAVSMPAELSSEALTHAQDVLNKYQTGGLDALSKQEQVTLERLTVYRDATTEKITDGIFAGYDKYVEGSLSAPTYSVRDAEAGLTKLKGYKGNTDITRKFGEVISETSKVSPVVGANAGYDVNVLATELRRQGQNALAEDIVNSRNGLVDIISTERMLAEAEEMSPTSYLSSKYGVQVFGTSSQDIYTGRLLNITQEHYAGSDALNEITAAIDQARDVREVAFESIEGTTSASKFLNKKGSVIGEQVDLEDTVLFFRGGTIDKTTGREFGVINGEVTANIGITGDYWTPTSGYYNPETGMNEIMFTSYSDQVMGVKNPRQFSIERSDDDIRSFISRNADVLERDAITKEEIVGNVKSNYRDKARREFERMFDANAVYNASEGFEGLSGYDKIKSLVGYSEIDEAGNIVSQEKGLLEKLGLKAKDLSQDTKGLYKLQGAIAEYNKTATTPINMTAYQMESLIGMADTIESEAPVLRHIVNKIEGSNLRNVDNIQKTIAMSDAYNSAIEELFRDKRFSRSAGRQVSRVAKASYTRRANENVWEIGVRGADIALDFTDQSSLAKSINNAINNNFVYGERGQGVYSRDIYSFLDKLEDAGVVSETSYNRAVKHIENATDSSGSWAVSTTLAGGVDFGKINETLSEQQVFTKRNVEDNIEQILNKRSASGNVGQMYRRMSPKQMGQFDSIIADQIAKTKPLQYWGLGDSIFDAVNSIGTELGYSKQGINTFAQMFSGTNNKSYALNEAADIASFVVKADNGNAYVIATTKDHVGNLLKGINNGEFNFDSYNALTTGSNRITRYAGVVEMPKINSINFNENALFNEYGIGTMSTITQGKNQKFIIPRFTTYEQNGVLTGGINTAEEQYLSAFRQKGSEFIKNIEEGDYEAASKAVRRFQNKYVDDMAGSSSAYTRSIGGKIQRTMNYTPVDFMQAYRMNVLDEERGLVNVFKHIVNSEKTNGTITSLDQMWDSLNYSQRATYAIGRAAGITPRQSESMTDYFNRVIESDPFKEEFYKNIFGSKLNEDYEVKKVLGNLPSANASEELNGTLLDLMIKDAEAVGPGNTSRAKVSAELTSSLKQLQGVQGQIRQHAVGEQGLKKGDVLIGIDQRAVIPESGLESTLRPVAQSEMNPQMFYLDRQGDLNSLANKGIYMDVTQETPEWADAIAKTADKDKLGDRRNFLVRAKQSNDYELQRKYIQLRKEASIRAKDLGITESQYLKGMDWFSAEYNSFAQDKMFMSPTLGATELMSRREPIKVGFNTSSIDVERTRSTLNKLIDKEVSNNTVIGYTNSGRAIRANVSAVTFTRDTVDELLPAVIKDNASLKKFIESGEKWGTSYALPTGLGDTMSTKIQLGGSEKSMAVAANIKNFANYMNTTPEEASRMLNYMWDQTFGEGVAVVANAGFIGHGNTPSIKNAYLTGLNEYTRAGMGTEYANMLNQFASSRGYSADMFRFENGRLINGSMNALENPHAFYMDFADRMMGQQAGGIASLNDRIKKQYMDSISDFTYMTTLQRQGVNEHMGKALKMDWRQFQGMLARDIGDEAAYGIANQTVDYIRAYNNIGLGRNKLRELERIKQNASGIITAEKFYAMGGVLGEEFEGTVLDIGINDIIASSRRPKSGVSAEEFQNSLFTIDGRPSEFLRKQAQAQGKNIKDINAIRLNLDRDIKIYGEGMPASSRSVIMPLANVSTLGDETFYQSISKDSNKLLNRLVEETTNTGKVKDMAGSVGSANRMSEAYQEYVQSIFKHLNTIDKESDLVKAITEQIAPYSTYGLSGSLSSTLFDSMLENDTELASAYDARAKAYARLRDGDLGARKAYEEANNKFNSIISGYQTRLRNGELPDALASNKFIEGFKKHGTIQSGGKTYHAMVAGMSKEAFEATGVDIGRLGYDTLNQSLRVLGEEPSYAARMGISAEYASNHINLTKLGEQLNVDITGLNTQEASRKLLTELNESIAVMGKNRDYSGFTQYGLDYLQDIGTYGIFNRSPNFRSYPVTKFIYDPSLNGAKDIRMSNEIFNSMFNADVDGDILGVALFLDKNKSMLYGEAGSKNTADYYAYRILHNFRDEHLKFATANANGLLAEQVGKVAAFKKEDPNNIGLQLSSLFEKAGMEEQRTSILNELIGTEKFKGFDLSNESDLLAIQSSEEFAYKASRALENMQMSSNMRTASMAAQLRKIYIGKVSTPSFKARDNLMRVLNDGELTADARRKVFNVFSDLSNMESKAGGFFSAAEQGAIDTKKAIDGLMLSSVDKYAAGLGQLTSGRIKEGSETLFNAVGRQLYGMSQEDMALWSSRVADNSFDVINEAFLKTARAVNNGVANGQSAKDISVAIELAEGTVQITGDKLDLLRTARGLRGLSDIATDNPLYFQGASLQKGSSIDKMLSDLNAVTDNGAAELTRGTSMSPLKDVFFNRRKLRHYKNTPKGSVFAIDAFNSTIFDTEAIPEMGSNEYRLAVWNGKRFKAIDETGKATKTIKGWNGRNLVDLNTDINAIKNKIVDPDELSHLVNKNRYLNIIENKRFDLLTNKVNDPADVWKLNGAHILDIFNEAEDAVLPYQAVYDRAVKAGHTVDGAPSSSAQLLRSINERIADDPSAFRDQKYSDLVQQELSKYVSKDALAGYMEEVEYFGGIDVSRIDSIINNNKYYYDEAYNIDKVNKSFKTLKDEMASPAVDNINVNNARANIQTVLDNESNVIADIKREIAENNYISGTEASELVYHRLGTENFEGRFNRYFGVGTDAQRIGFGQYIGKNVSSLTEKDANIIRQQMTRRIKEVGIDNLSSQEKYAIAQTKKMLDGIDEYAKKQIIRNENTASIVRDTVAKHDELISEVANATKNLSDEALNATKEAAKRKTLTGEATQFTKDIMSKVNKKAVAGVAATMLGIGALHHIATSDKSSPMSPEVTASKTPTIKNKNNVYYDKPNNVQQYEQDVREQDKNPLRRELRTATASLQKSIYTDNSTGLQFKVRAKTNRLLNNNKLGAAVDNINPGGSTNISVTNDTSRVSNNWLENKFAQLSL